MGRKPKTFSLNACQEDLERMVGPWQAQRRRSSWRFHLGTQRSHSSHSKGSRFQGSLRSTPSHVGGPFSLLRRYYPALQERLISSITTIPSNCYNLRDLLTNHSNRMRDSLTFTQALNLLKQPSDNSTRSSRTLKYETFQQIKSESKLPTIFSPKPKTVKRTNTTLKHIFGEFGQQPNNLYVLRLGTASK